MRPRDPFPSDVASESRRLMKSASSQSAYRRFQAVYLAASEHRQDADIAGITGLSERYIRSILARCRKGGVASLADNFRPPDLQDSVTRPFRSAG